jgi:AcrR family transcriptional regulator
MLAAFMSEPRPAGPPPRSRAPLRPDDGRLARGRRSRARIRAAARSLFRESGFDGATLRAIAARAGMGASSIYRHVRSKHELLVLDLAELQEEAWLRFRREDDRDAPTRRRVARFFEAQHALLAQDPDLTVIALRATTYPEARVARRVLALHDRTVGLLAELLQSGRRRDLDPDLDVLAASRAIFHVASGIRLSWANGLVDEAGCREAIDESVSLLFRGLGPPADD